MSDKDKADHNKASKKDKSLQAEINTERGDKLLENMLNTPPETHEEMKEKKK